MKKAVQLIAISLILKLLAGCAATIPVKVAAKTTKAGVKAAATTTKVAVKTTAILIPDGDEKEE